jgi:hypothetical protein
MYNNLDYSFDKLTDVLLVYREAQHNISAAVHLYIEVYPQRRLPDPRKFIFLDHHLRETSCLCQNMAIFGGQRSCRSVIFEEDILHVID